MASSNEIIYVEDDSIDSDESLGLVENIPQNCQSQSATAAQVELAPPEAKL